jgi:hypothetical protein
VYVVQEGDEATDLNYRSEAALACKSYGTIALNKQSGVSQAAPRLTAFGSKLYATWSESDGNANQIRVVVYGGDDGSPEWSFVDGDGLYGVNRASAHHAEEPQLSVVGSKLYATWQECIDTTANCAGAAFQIRVAEYNGDDALPSWTLIDGGATTGLNKVSSVSATSPQMAALNSKLYVTWQESDGSKEQIRVKMYDPLLSTWVFVDGGGAKGINKDTLQAALKPSIIGLDVVP